jgi:hypothetical protein
MAEQPKVDGWADHPRWTDQPRCRECGQPLIHPESVELGVCFRHRPSTAKTIAELGLGGD